jgi:LacI family transcriptional regulator
MTKKDKTTGPKRPATIKTVAAELGVSLATVSRAIRGGELVHPETRKLVLEVAHRQGYRRNVHGANLRLGRTSTFCAVLRSDDSLDFGDPSMMHLIRGLITGAEERGFSMMILPVTTDDGLFPALRNAIGDGRFDGVVIDHTLAHDDRAEYLLESGFPFITFGRTHLSHEHAYFDIDNRDAAYQATRNLIDKGHAEIALIDAPGQYTFTRQRQQGYLDALTDAGIEPDPGLMHFGPLRSNHVQNVLGPLFERSSPPTGLVIANEVSTLSAIRFCRSKGIDLRKVDVTSRDGTRFFDYFEPSVDSVYYPILTAGQRLTSMLADVVSGVAPKELQIVEKAQLIARNVRG